MVGLPILTGPCASPAVVPAYNQVHKLVINGAMISDELISSFSYNSRCGDYFQFSGGRSGARASATSGIDRGAELHNGRRVVAFH